MRVQQDLKAIEGRLVHLARREILESDSLVQRETKGTQEDQVFLVRSA